MPTTADWRLGHAARLLRRGCVIAHSTEAVIGLAASARCAAACRRVAALKARPRGKALIVVVAEVAQLRGLVSLEVPLKTEILASWPGPNTWILPMLPVAPRHLGGAHRALAVRVSAHAQVAALCRRAGPIVSTSANPSGRSPARSLFRARCYFGRQLACYLPGQLSGASRPSRVRDGRSGVVIRA